MAITASDVQDMITHWLRSHANRRFGIGYGSTIENRLMEPQVGSGIDRELAKLRDDITIVSTDMVNAYSRPRGVDGLDVFIQVGSVVVNATEIMARGALPSPESSALLTLSPASTTIVTTTTGVWDGAAASTDASVSFGGLDITASSLLSVADGPGVTSQLVGNTVSLLTVGDAVVNPYVDVSATGPFTGTLTRRWGITKSYSLPVDPFEPYLAMKLDFAGANGDGTITDLSPYARVGTALDGALVSTDHAFSGTTSGKFSASPTARFHVPAGPGLRTGSGNGEYCFEFRVFFTPVVYGDGVMVANYTSGAAACWVNTDIAGNLQCYMLGLVISTAIKPANNTWHHIACTSEVSGGFSIRRLFLNGVMVGTTTGGYVAQPIDTDWWIGGAPSGVSGFNGYTYIDDFRLYIGAAVYTADFTPPAAF